MMKNYDLTIIGGGPAGMMAGIQAGKRGARVLLLEKNKYLGTKLLITGKGRCNITNAEKDKRIFINQYGENGKFLHSAFNKFNNFDTINFFESLGLKTKVERGNRVFPKSDKAKDVLETLKKELEKNNVEIKTNSEVKDIILMDIHKDIHMNNDNKIILKNGEKIKTKNILISTGGKSYPGTGSTGDGYKWAKKIGHTIIEPKPALTPIIVKEKKVKELEGLSLKNVEISLWNKKKIASQFGEALFTGNGLSGPIILNLSNEVQKHKTKEGSFASLRMTIDFKPALDFPTLDKRIQKDFEESKNKQFKNSLDKLMPKKLISVIIELSEIPENKQVNEITKEERKKIVKILKEFELTVKGLVGFEKAIVTSGGINIKEINPKTCESKLIPGIYFAGEILDINGPTGGYNLQVAWGTGYLVGNSFNFD